MIVGFGIVSVLMLWVSFASYASNYGWHKDYNVGGSLMEMVHGWQILFM